MADPQALRKLIPNESKRKNSEEGGRNSLLLTEINGLTGGQLQGISLNISDRMISIAILKSTFDFYDANYLHPQLNTRTIS